MCVVICSMFTCILPPSVGYARICGSSQPAVRQNCLFMPAQPGAMEPAFRRPIPSGGSPVTIFTDPAFRAIARFPGPCRAGCLRRAFTAQCNGFPDSDATPGRALPVRRADMLARRRRQVATGSAHRQEDVPNWPSPGGRPQARMERLPQLPCNGGGILLVWMRLRGPGDARPAATGGIVTGRTSGKP